MHHPQTEMCLRRTLPQKPASSRGLLALSGCLASPVLFPLWPTPLCLCKCHHHSFSRLSSNAPSPGGQERHLLLGWTQLRFTCPFLEELGYCHCPESLPPYQSVIPPQVSGLASLLHMLGAQHLFVHKIKERKSHKLI